MLRSAVDTALSLEEWAIIMGLNPYRVAGFCDNVPGYSRNSSGCNGVWAEYGYQNERLSRYDVAMAIQGAESRLAAFLNYDPAPKYIEERLAYASNRGGLYRKDGQLKTVIGSRKMVRSVGAETFTSLGNIEITRVSEPGNVVSTQLGDVTIPDYWIATVTVPAGTVADEIHAYFTETDRGGAARDSTWEIRPITVTITGTTANVRGRTWLIGLPEIALGASAVCYDAANAAHYVTDLEFVRRSIDPCNAVTFVWGGSPCGSPPCGESTQSGCVRITNALCAVFEPYFADCDNEGVVKAITPRSYGTPLAVNINYTAGYALRAGRIDAAHAQMIAYMAAADLDCEICACDCTKSRLANYRVVPVYKTGEGSAGVIGDSYAAALTSDERQNPLGLRYGDLKAYRMARQRRVCL